MKRLATLSGKDREGDVEEEWELRGSFWHLIRWSYEIPVDQVKPVGGSEFDLYADLFDSVTYRDE
jgi:hypothetical protein